MIQHLADSMIEELRENNRRGEPTRWILPYGPVAQYPLVIERSNRERISWKNVFTFQMDAFLDWEGRPVPLDHPLNFEAALRRGLFESLDPDLRPADDHLCVPDPFAPDAIGERMRAVGGVDTCFGGIGYHGHVAFNDPPISRWYKISAEQMRQSRTRVVTIGDDSTVIISTHFTGGSCDLIPPMAVTIGMREIYACRKIRLYLTGGQRHRAVFRISLLADPTSDYPATVLQGHPDCIVFTDEETAQPIRPTLEWGLAR